jgi:uracil-DNA glycosylase family 4
MEVRIMSYGQASQLKRLEDEASKCKLCLSFPPQKRLKNVILGHACADLIDFWPGARQPLPPPSHLLMLAQDYGPEGIWNSIRKSHVKAEYDNFVICEGKRIYYSTTLKILEFLLKSIGLRFGDVFLANVILCARSSDAASGDGNINTEAAMKNCCIKREHLWKLLNIVKPRVIATLGSIPLKAIQKTLVNKDISVPHLLATKQLSGLIQRRSIRMIPDLQVSLSYSDRPVPIIPLYHPAARPRNRTIEEQKADYRLLRMALDACCDSA